MAYQALFTKLVKVAGFTVSGREWIANGFVSLAISVITFQVCVNAHAPSPPRAPMPTPMPAPSPPGLRCALIITPSQVISLLPPVCGVRSQVYANTTRFEWAYPSGLEEVFNQWIAGHTMTLATIIMNMVYLTSETRSRIGEPGINDPNVKIFVTAFTFALLLLLRRLGHIDPSFLDMTVRLSTVYVDYHAAPPSLVLTPTPRAGRPTRPTRHSSPAPT